MGIVLVAFIRATAAGVVTTMIMSTFQPNHLRRKLLEPFSLTSCITALDDEVAALLVPVFSQALEQCVIKAFMSVRDKSHPPNFVCLLRARH